MTDFDARPPQSAAPDSAAVKEAFARCFAIDDPDRRSEALERLERESPSIAAEVRLLLKALQSSEKAERVSAFVPMLDLSLESAPERLEDLTDVPSSADPANFRVLRSMEETIASVPHVVLKASGEEEPVVKLRSSELDPAWHKQHGRYRLDGEIARGGMGAILKGRDTDLGRDLAIKVLLNEHRDNPNTVQRFIEEAQIGGQLQHPGIAPVYELGQFPDERPFFTMKLIKGKTLAALLSERKSIEDDRARYLGIFEQICQTMAYAHSRGVLHRDLKPSNVMVGAFGEVQVMDWGLAKVLAAGGVADERKQRVESEDRSLIQTVRSVDSGSTRRDDGNTAFGSATRMGSIMGTPAYMAPEQAAGEIDRLDQRADVFSLGSILCEILTGDPVYRRSKHVDRLMLARQGDIGEAGQRLDASSADAEVIALAKDCLAIDRNQRPSDAQAVSERIGAYLESVDRRLRETELEVARTKTKAEEERKRRRVVVALAGCVVLAVLLGAGGWLWVQEKEAQLVKIKADAKVAAAAERSELEQRVQGELAAAEALADSSEQMPSSRDLERARESLQRVKHDLSAEDFAPSLTTRFDGLWNQVVSQQADMRLAQRLEEIWEIEQQYFAEKDLPPFQDTPSNDDNASEDRVDQNRSQAGISNPASLYAEAFADWGFRLHETAHNELMARVQRMSPIQRTAVIASLDRWRQLLDAEPSLVDWVEQDWTHLEPVEVRSNWGDEFTIRPDQSVLVTGPNVTRGYEVVLDTEATEISALRLEMLLDESLPNNGPGRASGGFFDLKGLKVAVTPRTEPENRVSVVLANGLADSADITWPFQISHWRTWGDAGRARVAFYRLSETISHPDGFRITISIDDSIDPTLAHSTPGHFRWSSTRVDDHSAEKASLESLLAGLDTDPWRKRLRKALLTSDSRFLMELATEPGVAQKQPSILLAQLANQLISYTGAERKALLAAETDFQVVHPTEVTTEQGTEYSVREDGVIVAGENNPAAEVTTIIIPAKAIDNATRLIRLEFLSADDEAPISYIGRQKFLRLREIAVTRNSAQGSHNILDRVFADYPFPVSLAKAVDGDIDTTLMVPTPDRPSTFYLVLDPDLLAPDERIEIKLHTGSESYFPHSNPVRIRIAASAGSDAFHDPFHAAEQLLMASATEQSSDPLVHLQLARYYKSTIPVRTDDALRHVMIASSLLPDSIVPSLAFLDLVEPGELIDNRPLRQVAIEHVRRVEARHSNGSRTLRLRFAIEGAVIENYAQGKVAEAEQLLDFGLRSLRQDREFVVLLFQRLRWEDLPVESTCDSLLRCIEQYLSQRDDDSELAFYCNALGKTMFLSERFEQALQLSEKGISLDPDSVIARRNRAVSLMRLNRLEESVDAYQKAIEVDPADPEAKFELAIAYFGLKQHDVAFAEFQKSVEVSGENKPHQHFRVGRYLAQRKSLRLADLEAIAAGADETFTESRQPISTQHARLAVEEAISHLERAVELSPDDRSYVLELGVATYRDGNWQQAVNRLEQYEAMAASDYDRDRWHLFLLAMASWQLGDREAALRYFGLGSAWAQVYKADDAECNQIRSEAALLLGLVPEQQAQLKITGYENWLKELSETIDWEVADFLAWRYRGVIHSRMGRDQAAIADLSEAIKRNPGDTYAVGVRAYSYRNHDQLDLALADRDRIIELQPLNNERYFERADERRKRGEYELAIADIERGFQVDPSRDVSWFPRARARTTAGDIYLLDLNDNQQAVLQYNRALQHDPDYFTALRGRAHAHWQLKNYEQGLADITRAIELQPQDATSFGIRAEIYLELGQLNEALEDRNRAVEIVPHKNLRYFERARLHRFRGEFDLAFTDIQKGLEVDPEGDVSFFSRAAAHNLAGDIYLDDLDELEKALAQYEMALQLDPSLEPNSPTSRLPYRGYALYDMGRYEQAIACLTEALENDPNNASLVGTRADCYRRLKQLDLALADCNRVVELEPACNARYFERARVHHDRGDFELALADIEKGMEVEPDRGHRWFSRARAHALAGDLCLDELDQPVQALEHYKKAILFNPENVEYQRKREKAAQAVNNSSHE